MHQVGVMMDPDPSQRVGRLQSTSAQLSAVESSSWVLAAVGREAALSIINLARFRHCPLLPYDPFGRRLAFSDKLADHCLRFLSIREFELQTELKVSHLTAAVI